MHGMRVVSLFIVILLALSIDAKPDPEKLKKFEEWARERIGTGDLSEKIAIMEQTDYRQLRPGVVALEDISKDEILAEFGMDYVINSRTLEKHEIGEILQRVHLQFGNGQMFDPAFVESLALFLIYERYVADETSKYRPWIDILPDVKEMNNILFWSASEIKYLQGSPLHKRAMDRRKEVKDHWEWLQMNIFGPYIERIWKIEIKEDMYKWAISIVRSRNVQILLQLADGYDQYQPALVPFLDVFRHTPMIEDESYWGFDELDRIVNIRADRDFKAGEEVVVAFGEKCNSELLDFHGFIIDANPNDCVHAEIAMSKTDPLFTEKNIIWRAKSADNSQLKFMRNGLTVELFRAARVVTLQPEMIQNSYMMKGLPDESLGPISDLLVANFFVQKVSSQLQGYPKGDDEINLEDPEISPRLKLAIQLKQGEKYILRRLGNHFYSEFNKLSEELKDELKSLSQKTEL